MFTTFDKVCENRILVNSELIERAKHFESSVHTTPYDSLHLALAEESADYFITTDVRLEKAANKSDSIIETMNPINFIREEVIGND